MYAGLLFRIAVCLLIAIPSFNGSIFATAAFAQSGAGDPAREPYSLSYAAGRRDAHGTFLGGSELMNLVPFGGKLYAGVGYWMDRREFYGSTDPRSAAQVIVLDSKGARWRQEFAFDEDNGEDGFKYHRPSTMQVLHFHRFDAAGNVVGSLVDILAVGLDVPLGAVYTQSSPGHWADTRLPTSNPIRSLVVHYDRTDGVEKIYAGPGGGQDRDIDRAIYSGVYDPSAPGRIRWSPEPERTGIDARVVSMVDCGGTLFAAAKPSIFRRDDSNRRWEVVYSYPMPDDPDEAKVGSGFRGLTCMDDGASGGKTTLLSGFDGFSGEILSIDPDRGAAVSELRTRQFLTQQWGGPPVRPDIITGYNDSPVIKTDPETRVFSLLVASPNANEENSAWFISRTTARPPEFALHEVRPLRWPNRRSDASLWSVRTMAVSPFPEDQGKVMYMGGYDGHYQPVHNTAWLYRVGIDTALRPYNSAGR